MHVAETILEQMGGIRRLRLMTGAHSFVADSNMVMFGFKGSRAANKCRVTLLPNDTYKFEVFKITKRGLSCKTVAEHDEVYFDQLMDLFEAATGLYLTLNARV